MSDYRLEVAMALQEFARRVLAGGITRFDIKWDGGAKLEANLGLSKPVDFVPITFTVEEPKGPRCTDCGGSMEGASGHHKECGYCRNRV